MHRGPNAFLAKIGCGAVLTLFWSLEVGRGRQNAIRSQNYEVPKAYLPKLSKLSFAAHITSPHNPLEEVICVGKLKRHQRNIAQECARIHSIKYHLTISSII